MGLLSRNNDKTGKKVCPVETGENTIYDHGTAHVSLYAVAGVCAAVTLLSSVLLIIQHLRRYRVPKEQRHIVKIIFTPFAFAIVAWGSISNYRAAPFIDPLGEYYSSFCLPALFLLYIQFVAPDSEYGDGMFQAMHRAAERRLKNDKGDWPRTSWVMVFQYPVTETLAIVILEATQAAGTYCASSMKPRFGHIWVSLIKTLGVAICFITIVRFYARTKFLVKARRGMFKLVCFKGIVLLRFIQTWIFNILTDQEVMKPSKQLSYGDLVYGIPNTVLAAEMVVFSLGFWYAYSSTEYSSAAKPHKQRLNTFHALFDSMNPSDLILGVVRAAGLIGSKRRVPTAGQYAYSGPATYGRVEHHGNYHGGHGRDRSVDEQVYGGYSQGMYQPHPTMYRNEEEEELAKRHLMADAGRVRTPSPMR